MMTMEELRKELEHWDDDPKIKCHQVYSIELTSDDLHSFLAFIDERLRLLALLKDKVKKAGEELLALENTKEQEKRKTSEK